MQVGDVQERVRSVLPQGRSVGDLARASFRRFRGADGTSHSRSLAYQMLFVVLSGFIGLIGLASVLDVDLVRGTVVEMSKRLAPGPSSKLIEEAVRSGSNGASTAMVLGLGSAFVAGVFAMAQLERSGNRIAGAGEDRPEARRWGTAAGLAASAGIAIAIAMLVLGAGQSIATGAGFRGGAATLWTIVRWPLGLALATAGMFLLFRTAPERRLAETRDLLIGSLVAVGLWLVLTIALSAYFSSGGAQREAYGSLLAIVALVVWTGATSLAVHLGMAVSAELGASGAGPVRVGDADPARARSSR